MFWAAPSIRGGGGIDSPRPASQRAAALVLTAAMLTTLAAPAFAATWRIEDGDITVKAGEIEGTNKVSQGTNKDVVDTDTIITNRDKNTASSHTVTIKTNDKNDTVEVTLKDVNIDTSSRNNAAVSVTGSGNTTIKLDGDNHLAGGNGIYSNSSGSLTISGGTVTATGGDSTGSNGLGGRGICSDSGGITISGGSTVTANGGNGSSGRDGISSSSGVTVSDGTVTATGGNSTGSYGSGGDGIRSDGGVTISGGTVEAAGGVGKNGSGGSGIYSSGIDLSGSLELTAKAGSPNGKALSRAGSELELDDIKKKLDPGAKVTTINANGETKQVSIPRPVEPEKPVIPEESSSSSDGGSAAPSASVSPLPGLTVTDKSGAVISYTSTQSGNTLTVCVGRFTASLRASLSALRQLRAEGIETITFQTILCSTTLSVDELLAMGGEDAEAVLTHRLTDSSLTVG